AASRAVARRRTRRRPLRRALGIVARTVLVLVAGYLVACAALLSLYRGLEPPVTTVQVQRMVEAAFAGEPMRIDYRPVPASAMAPAVRHAAVAAEDSRFYQHRGFDFEELRRAREEAERQGRPPRGASTITQQLVKNLFLTTHRSWVRKGLEVPLTVMAELILPKERILTLYLNVAEWGPGVFGIEAAAQHHYDRSARRLTRNQAARLAACLPNPRQRTPQQMTRSAARIEARMRQMGY
ncbi:MAG: monofunctional biosynthetic peptidoglycan transglycosylase, partial [Rubricoccaceae bacterium]